MDTTFEEMRQQMAILKKKLEKQEIINESIIRQTMKKNASNILIRYYLITLLGILIIPFSYWVFIKINHFSLAFWIGTSIFMLICMCVTLYNSRNLNATNLFGKDLMESQRLLARAKKFDSNWLLIGIPLCLIWLAWLTYELYRQGNNEGTYAMFVGEFTGAAIGTALGLTIHYKTQRQYQEMLEQIEELKRIED